MFSLNKDQNLFLTGIAIGSLIGTLSAALFFVLSTRAVVNESVKSVNKIGEPTENLSKTTEPEKPKRRTRKRKTEPVEES